MFFDVVSLWVVLASLALLLASAAMMAMHVRTWRAHRVRPLDAEEFDYRRRQFRRRVQTTAMLGALAVALSAGHFGIDRLESGWISLAFWGATMAAAGWVALLALVDAWATRHYFNRQYHRAFLEETRRAAQKEIGRET